MTVVDMVHLDCQSQRIALNKDVDDSETLSERENHKHGTHDLYDKLYMKIADR